MAAVEGVCGDASLARGAADETDEEVEMKVSMTEIESPIGTILAVAGPRGLCDVDFADRWEAKRRRLERRLGQVEIEDADPLGIADHLRRYFDGQLSALGTEFQHAVWTRMRAIPAGTTMTYGELAAEIGNPAASRAVGAASGRNPIAIVIPCHRLIGTDGSLTGYAGGVPRKRWLLAHEGALPSALEGLRTTGHRWRVTGLCT
jgi:methylated-DNA-[protein]-cysteine S-methyltransferase